MWLDSPTFHVDPIGWWLSTGFWGMGFVRYPFVVEPRCLPARVKNSSSQGSKPEKQTGLGTREELKKEIYVHTHIYIYTHYILVIWGLWKILFNWMVQGYPPFWKTPYTYINIYKYISLYISRLCVVSIYLHDYIHIHFGCFLCK